MRIVVGIENRLYGEAIIKFIGTQSWPAGTEFFLVNVVEQLAPSEVLRRISCPDVVALLEAKQSIAKELLDDLTTQLEDTMPDCVTRTKVLYGSAKERLLEEVEALQSDMLIVGSHGHTGSTRFMMGSVSLALLSHAPCTMRVVKLGQDQKRMLPDMSQFAVAM